MKNAHSRPRPGFVALTAALAMTLFATLPGAIQGQEADGRWLAWTGCWQTTGDLADGSMLCVRPVPDGVEMLTIADSEVVSTDVVRADGRAHPIEQDGCTGSRVAEFGREAHRIYVEEEYVCEGVVQRTTGMIAMISPMEWVDIRAIEADSEAGTWVRNYRLASTQAAEEAGFAGLNAGREIPVRTARYRNSIADLDDVIDVATRVSPDVASAWIVERGERFDVDADRLVRLADAGVPSEVIDVVVAASFPDRFALGGDRPEERYAERRGSVGYGYHDPYFYGGSWGFRYNRFFNPYYSFGYYRPYRRSVIIVRPRDRDDGVFGRGRVVQGRGYTRGSSGGSTGGTARGSTGSSGSAGTARGSAGSRSTGRKAKPRTGGGGGSGGGGDGGGTLLFF